IFNFNFPEIFGGLFARLNENIRGKRISCTCISINLYCSSEFPRNTEELVFGVSKHQFFLPYFISYTIVMHTIEDSLYR
ncbi:unnamed protein product, partial [Brassica oleracea]